MEFFINMKKLIVTSLKKWTKVARTESLNDTLDSGKIGLIFLDYYFGNIIDHKKRVDIINELLSKNDPIYKTLFLGKVCVALLLNEIYPDDKYSNSFTTEVTREYINNYTECPIKYNFREKSYLIWIIFKKLLRNHGSELYRYSIQENMITLLMDCDVILNRHIPYLHNPADLEYGMLHSIYCFAKEAEQRRIYTFKAHEIQQIIKNWPYRIRENNPAGKYILDFVVGREIDESEIMRLTDDKKLNMLAEVGLYAFLYEMPALFKRIFDFLTVDDMRFYQLIERELSRSDVSARMVIGIGLGVITCEKNAKD